jgi:hypothetical protein
MLYLWLAPAPASALFTQCPPFIRDQGCQFLVVVSDGGAQVVQDPTQGPYDKGEEDALLAVQNNSSRPISSIGLYAKENLFAFDNDGLCNILGEPQVPGCVVLAKNSAKRPTKSPGVGCPPERQACGLPAPPGEPPGISLPAGIRIDGYAANGDPVTGYEGPTSWFSNVSSRGNEGVVNFGPAIAPGSSAYFALEAPPRGEVPATVAPTSTSTVQSGDGFVGTSITVPVGTRMSDTAQIAGPQAASASGTVTYVLYKDNKCTAPAAVGSTTTVVNGIAGSSAAVEPGPGTYYWKASYSGDSVNAPSGNPCGDEVLQVARTANLQLPSSRICLSNRRFIAHPRAPWHVTLTKVVVTINGTLKFSGKLSGRQTTIDLRGLPRGTFRVAMIVTSSNGHVYIDVRTFHTCIPGHHPKRRKK